MSAHREVPMSLDSMIITPPNAPVGEVLEVKRGIKFFAGPRTDSFFNFLPFPITLANALNEGFFPDLAALFPPTDFFMNQIVRSVLVEVPARSPAGGG